MEELMPEPDRQADLDRIAAEERAVAQAKAQREQAEQERRRAQGRLEKPR
jgi:hypothetical protein